ncbi:MAG: glutamate--tRNA ligase [Spirochaetes bacterium]|nr:glutamate--tRNA ligase [Spirochaetota bacterium]
MSVRVRYAPSPTGFQHIGGARTALFNYLFARSQGGAFILRIEDTDRSRFVPEALQDIYDTYRWLGFGWDEGPDVGGPKGPYVQSERTALYREHAERLVADGHAYRCWCTPERLERLRASQAGSKGPQGYDRHCRELSPADRAAAEASGVKPVIRLKVPAGGTTTFTDRLLGEVAWKNADINPDPVLLKSDGFPTYHLANVVDDHLMEITDILRAQEWLPSVPLHVQLYRAFGWEPPRFCHLPMVLGKDGQKLSKRHGATSVREFRRQGYLPDALVNYLALVGWSYDDSRELFSLADLERLFDVEKLNKAAAVFDYQKLDWFNGTYLRAKSQAEVAALIRPSLEEAGFAGNRLGDAAFLEGVAGLVQERVKLLTEVPGMVRYLFEGPAAYAADDLVPKKTDRARAAEMLERLKPLVEAACDGDPGIEVMARELAERLGAKLGDLLMPLRVAITGSKVSPPLFESIGLIGRDRARAAVDAAIGKLRGA